MIDNSNDQISPEGSGDMAVIGEGTPNRTPISIQVLQNIYHEITGKSEEVSRSYNNAFRVNREDFEQLNHRIMQVCEQYNICTSNCSIKIYYINDTQETFSSFERFRAFNAGSSSSIESVLITYNLLILLPKLNQPQSYTLRIRVASRIAIEKKIENEVPFGMPKILRVMGGRTAIVTVKYVDYVVARTLLNTADEWFGTIPQSKMPAYWEFIRKRSGYVPLITRYIVGAIVTLIIFSSLPTLIPPNATLLDFAKFWLLASVGIFTTYKFAHHLGSAAENSIDRWNELSYVSLTNGDKNEIEEATRRNKSSIFSAILKLFVALIISLAAKIVTELLINAR